MYVKPLLAPLDPTSSNAICCTISSETFIIRTPLCPFPTCGDTTIVTTAAGALPCTVTVGPVTISGN